MASHILDQSYKHLKPARQTGKQTHMRTLK